MCCECRGKFRNARDDEAEFIRDVLREGEWPPDVNDHELIGAKVCVNCGHVTVLTHRGECVAVWCPGFGLHDRVIFSSN
jgi:hypothetical protein